jgi:hypothetical protein
LITLSKEVQMKKLATIRPTPAMVVACLALFVAMGGVGYAAVKLKPNSVKTKSIKNGAVTEAKIADGAGTGPKIADGAVTSTKIADGAVTSTKIADRAVTSGKFFLNSVTTQNFGAIAGPSCDSRQVAVPGLQATDYVVVTPPPGYPNTFTLEGHPNAAGTGVTLVACNTFDGGGTVDPDGTGGGSYKLLVIR